MDKLIKLSKTGIEYGDYAWNPASGCGNNIAGKCKDGGFNCWAYSITQRFKGRYPNGFEPTVYPEALLSPLYLKKPSRILVCFMGDLFSDCPEFDPDRWLVLERPGYTMGNTFKEQIYETIRKCPQHTFIFLTKQPQNLPAWSPFPENCEVGVTAINSDMFADAIYYLSGIEASVKYISVEPLLSKMVEVSNIHEHMVRAGINWVIIGAQTKPYKPPAIEDVREIVEACDQAGTPVFLKNNLKPLFTTKVNGEDFIESHNLWAFKYLKLRQELPEHNTRRDGNAR